jgi:sec-independent protein translocase protein TatC
MASTVLRPIGHEDHLSLVDHLDELRTRLIVSFVTLAVAFGICAWQNQTLLNVINKPLEHETQKAVSKGKGPLGAIAVTQKRLAATARTTSQALEDLAAPQSGLPAATRARLKARALQVQSEIAKLPKVSGNKPVTLGIGEPFTATLKVAFYFSLLLSLPVILYQLYAFLLPAFNPQEKRVALPLMSMIPGLFVVGVVFGYFVVLPAAIRFLQNFNTDSFNVLVQARDYYKFAVMTLLSMGLVFQMPVGILAVTRLGLISVDQLRRNRRYAIVAIAVVAMLLPGTDPVSMLIEFIPLVALYELSILLARWLVPGAHPRDEEDDDDAPTMTTTPSID